MGFRRKWTTVTLCKSARSAIQLFYIHNRKYFAIILNSAIYLSSTRVSMFHTLVSLLYHTGHIVTYRADITSAEPFIISLASAISLNYR